MKLDDDGWTQVNGGKDKQTNRTEQTLHSLRYIKKIKTCISLIEVTDYIKKNKWSQGPGEVLYSININTYT